MSKGLIIAGAFMVAICCSASSAAMLMMGGEEKSTTITGPGPAGPACESGKTITGHTGSLGACSSLTDIKPTEIKFQGAFFSPRNPVRNADWVHELSSSPTKREFIASHQSPDNLCKMVRFEVTKDNGDCNYKVIDAGYTASPTDASTCTTKSQVLSHWGSKNPQTLATSNEENGYGIETLKYSKYC